MYWTGFSDVSVLNLEQQELGFKRYVFQIWSEKRCVCNKAVLEVWIGLVGFQKGFGWFDCLCGIPDVLPSNS